jgi:hypothetical protein
MGQIIVSTKDEFLTVDLILDSGAITQGVDAFTLSLIKSERQLRRIFTHLVYQDSHFSKAHVAELRKALVDRTDIYFEEFIRGFDALYPKPLRAIIGSDYERLLARLCEATEYRNKIFHGQVTEKSLKRPVLVALVKDIRNWCEILAANASQELGYDGFARNSYQKSARRDLASTFKVAITDLNEYVAFMEKHMKRGRRKRDTA